MGRRPGEHFVQDASERVDVTPPIHIPVLGYLLRTHIQRRPHQLARGREGIPASGRDGTGDTEIGYDRLTGCEQDVARLDITVEYILSVRVVECFGYLSCDADRVWHRERPVSE